MTTFLIGQKQHMANTSPPNTHTQTLSALDQMWGLHSMGWVMSTYLQREIQIQENSPSEHLGSLSTLIPLLRMHPGVYTIA